MNHGGRFVVTWGMINANPLGPRLLVLAALLLAAQSAACQEDSVRHDRPGTGSIRGTVSLRPAEDSGSESPHDLTHERYSTNDFHDNPGPAVEHVAQEWKRSERAVVYLESATLDEQGYHVPEKHPVLDQKNLEFHPRVLPILVGTTVDFPNRDKLFHNVFSYSEPKEFDLGRYPQNDSRSVTFDRPGIVRVYCDIHSHMSATILVLQNPFFTTTSDNGSYNIQHIPQGKYVLVLWYDRSIVERRPVELKAGETLEVDFTF